MLQITHVLMLSCVLGVITLALATDLVVVLSWLRRRLSRGCFTRIGCLRTRDNHVGVVVLHGLRLDDVRPGASCGQRAGT